MTSSKKTELPFRKSSKKLTTIASLLRFKKTSLDRPYRKVQIFSLMIVQISELDLDLAIMFIKI